MEETNRGRSYESYERRRDDRQYERAAEMPRVSTGSMVAMVLGTLLLALLAVWAMAQGAGGGMFSSAGLEQHFCRYITC